MLLPVREKTLSVRVLECLLVLFALHESGVLHLGYQLYQTRGSLNLHFSSGVSVWVYYYLRNLSALSILGYVLFRNSNWCRALATRSTEKMDPPPGRHESRASMRELGAVGIVELCLVLFVAFASSVVRSLEVFAGHTTLFSEPKAVGLANSVYSMLSPAAAIGLLSYVLDRRCLGFQDLGLRWTSRDVATALPLALGSMVGYWIVGLLAAGGVEMAGGRQPQVADIGSYLLGTSVSMAAVFGAVLNGFFEELIVRGYLMTEVRRLTGSILFAMLCSMGVQCSYHLYQGGLPAMAHVGGFLVFAGYYAKTNRLLPLVLAHSALDLYAVVMHALRPT